MKTMRAACLPGREVAPLVAIIPGRKPGCQPLSGPPGCFLRRQTELTKTPGREKPDDRFSFTPSL